MLLLALLSASVSVAGADFVYPAYIPTERRIAHSLNRTITVTYAGDNSSVKAFLQNYTTTTWAIEAEPTDAFSPYGQYAYKQLWSTINNITQPAMTVVATPTPVPTSELFFPPTIARVEGHHNQTNYTFGPDAIWGLASSAQQVEGAIQVDGSGPSILDNIWHNLLTTQNNSDIAALNYYKYKEDIARLAAIGVPRYSFSIKWARVVPFGKAGSPINQQAIAHYSDVIDTCRQYGVEPMVTLTHWDTPLAIGELVVQNLTYGSFNAGYDQDDFVENYLYYAKYIVAQFADRVGTFYTFNELQVVSANVIEARNAQLAHAGLYHFYHDTINGSAKITFKQTHAFALPLNASSPSDIAAANRQNEFQVGLFSNAAFLGQNIPAEIISTVNDTTKAFPFTDAELAYINGTADYFALDTYSAVLVTAPTGGIDACASNKTNPLWPICVNASSIDPTTGYILSGVGQPASTAGAAGPLANTPSIERTWLRYISETYRPRGGILITELGTASNHAPSTPFASYITDEYQARYLTSFYQAILDAKVVDGVDVLGAITWSAIDNWEFGDYTQRFGLQYVDYASPNKTRTYKTSMFSLIDFWTRFTY